MNQIAQISDKDAYACGGQKCSAQSLMFVHRSWDTSSLYDKMSSLASERVPTPVLSWTDDQIQAHIASILEIPGTRVLVESSSGEIRWDATSMRPMYLRNTDTFRPRRSSVRLTPLRIRIITLC